MPVDRARLVLLVGLAAVVVLGLVAVVRWSRNDLGCAETTLHLVPPSMAALAQPVRLETRLTTENEPGEGAIIAFGVLRDTARGREARVIGHGTTKTDGVARLAMAQSLAEFGGPTEPVIGVRASYDVRGTMPNPEDYCAAQAHAIAE